MRHHRDPAGRRPLTIQIASLITGGFMEPTAVGGGADVPATPHDLPMRAITLETGPALHYFAFGEGHPVIFVHGSFADYRAWFGQVGPFGERFKALTYSRRHHHPNRWNTDARQSCTLLHVDDLACLIRRLDLAPATLVGQSSGGLVAMHTAARYPELVHSLVLSEPFVPDLLDLADGGPAAWADYESRFWLPAGRAFADGRTERGVELLCDAILGDGAFAGFPDDIRLLVMQNAPEMHLEFSNPAFFSSFTARDVALVRAPVMLVEGGREPGHLSADDGGAGGAAAGGEARRVPRGVPRGAVACDGRVQRRGDRVHRAPPRVTGTAAVNPPSARSRKAASRGRRNASSRTG